MTKLDGNNRWGTKMVMTEHAEQYDRRDQPRERLPTTEELTMIRDAIMLPHLMTIVQRGIDRTGNTVLNPLHAKLDKLLMDRIAKDLYDLRRELRQRNIRIVSDEMGDDTLYYRYVCRGHHDRFAIVREVLKSQISIRLGKYYDEMCKSVVEQFVNKPSPV